MLNAHNNHQGQCTLLVDEATETQLSMCTDDINHWLEQGLHAAIANSSVLIAFQV